MLWGTMSKALQKFRQMTFIGLPLSVDVVTPSQMHYLRLFIMQQWCIGDGCKMHRCTHREVLTKMTVKVKYTLVAELCCCLLSAQVVHGNGCR